MAVLTSNLSFAPQVVGTSTTQSATLTNNGDAALDITSIVASGDYSQTNACPASLPGGSSCTIQVSFTPTAAGPRNGTVTVVDDDPVTGQQTLSLTGTGLDYSVSASPASFSIKAGQTATYTVSVSALGGSFPNAVSFACAGLPAGASCSFSPASVAPGAGVASSALSLVTSNGAHGIKKTPDGTYTITIAATSGSLNHTAAVKLVVQ